MLIAHNTNLWLRSPGQSAGGAAAGAKSEMNPGPVAKRLAQLQRTSKGGIAKPPKAAKSSPVRIGLCGRQMERELLGCDDCQVLMRQVLDQNWYIANDVLQRVLSPCQIHVITMSLTHHLSTWVCHITIMSSCRSQIVNHSESIAICLFVVAIVISQSQD